MKDTVSGKTFQCCAVVKNITITNNNLKKSHQKQNPVVRTVFSLLVRGLEFGLGFVLLKGPKSHLPLWF